MNAPNALRNTHDLYHSIVNEVVSNVREAFIDDGVDESVIKDLREIWQQKLNATKVVEAQPSNSRVFNHHNYVPPPSPMSAIGLPQQAYQMHRPTLNTSQQQLVYRNAQPHHHLVASAPNLIALAHQQQSQPSPISAGFLATDLQAGTMLRLNHPTMATASFSSPSTSAARTINLSMPMTPCAAAATGDDGHNQQAAVKYLVMSQQPMAPAATPTRPISAAATASAISTGQQSRVIKMEATGQSLADAKKIIQLDGPGAGGESEDEFDEFDDENGQTLDENEVEEEDTSGIVEEGDPLNSDDDDVVNENVDNLFEAEDVVVCQYEKVVRTRNKWKFLLKDGVMHLGGKDFVFNKAVGDSEF